MDMTPVLMQNLMTHLVTVYLGRRVNLVRSDAKLVSILISAKLVQNWQAKYAKRLDPNNPKLKLNIYIWHRSAILNKKIRMPEQKKIIILRKT